MPRSLTAACLLSFAIVAAVLPATDAGAQGPGGRGRGMGGMMSHAALLRQEAVQTELGLSADQKTKLAAELPERGPGGGGGNFRDMSDEERQKWMAERRARQAEDDAKIAATLDAGQLARLKQIRVQAIGAAALMDEAIAKDVGVSADQVRTLQEALQEMREQGGGDPGAMRQKMYDKAVSILDADQKAKLEALRGPAFDVSKLQMRGPGGGGRPGSGN